MRYIDALKLVNTCVKENILKTHENHIAIYRNKGKNTEEGWYLISKEELAKTLMSDDIGQRTLIGALAKKNISFEQNK